MMVNPTLRFKDDNGNDYPDWMEKKLGDVFQFFKPGGLKKEDLNENGNTYCIHYGHLFTEYNEVIYQVKFKTDKKGFLSKNGDILMPSSDVTPLGLAKASALLLDDVLLGGDINILRAKSDVSSEFFSYTINYHKKKILDKVSGTTVKHIYIRDIVENQYYTPSLPEQQKIASFLSSIDEKINLTDKKLELLKQYKQGVMQQIFNQEIRFKDDNGNDYPDWMEKKLGDVSPLQRGFDLPLSTITEGGYPVVGSNGIIAYHNDYKCYGEGVITGRSGSIGFFTYLPKCKYWPHNTSLWVKDFKGNSAKFIYYLYLSVGIERFSSGSGVPTLNRNDVHAFHTSIPSLPEQQKIASFLSSIDEKINLIDRQLDNLKQYKKSLLQQMFV